MPAPATPLTVEAFRAALPEFASEDVFPDSGVQFWLNLAYEMLRPERWRNLMPIGVQMFVAHNLVIEAFNQQTVDVGGLPGINKGPISSETPGQVAVSYDTGSSSLKDQGHWNLTSFGTRFVWMMRMAGAGPVQVGTPGGTPCGPGFGEPWYGPRGGFN